MTGYEEADEIKTAEKSINDFPNDYEKDLKVHFDTNWKRIGIYN